MPNESKNVADEGAAGAHTVVHSNFEHGSPPLDGVPKGRWERLWPVIACGAGLFSDGYLNSVIGSVNTILRRLYPVQYGKSKATNNFASIAFAGIVVGQLVFGYASDHYSLKYAMIISTIILIVFAALGSGSYGSHGSVDGMLAALTAYRFFPGIGIGGEYPAGSVACAEATGELKRGHRNRWFILFTNTMIDIGFVVSAFVPLVLLWIFGMHHLRAVWRLTEPEEFKRETMRDTKVPYLLVLKSARTLPYYAGQTILDNILGEKNSDLYKAFGWNVVINLFYIPGALTGPLISDWAGPSATLGWGVLLQGIVGFIMASAYAHLAKAANVAGFVVVYGIFLSLGEMGPGDNIGPAASKTSATAIRGQYYGIAAAFGKVGAFIGSYIFPIIQDNAPTPTRRGQDPFFVSSSLCIFSAALAFFLLPHIGQDTISEEDLKFRKYLAEQGWDINQLGDKEYQCQGNAPANHVVSGER
ncbi:hypothetical protein GP486_004668 [Trichoglossum hirsutum]|uniref:Major facilitator superfamily (MFS) profile domain-containing protein n=1 Tax=Trichoglossum hirsutum TaxID=265104 RepID=A0A9P8RNN2_9PEZI|nr:hypothetical protein GP486_004668 [Trichoglossum hirsutum]